MKTVVECKNVSFSYGNQEILKDVSFAINSGEFVFIVGKSGSGKSTLMQLLYFNLMPMAGEVNCVGYSSYKLHQKDISDARRKLGIVFQDFRLLTDRNIFDNLSFVLEVTGYSRKEIKDQINRVLSEVGLFHKRKNFPNELSGGEKQRVAIARAIVNEPRIVLADEPTGNLDPETTNEIFELIKRINQRGTAVLFSTHNYELIKRNPFRLLKLENGVLSEYLPR